MPPSVPVPSLGAQRPHHRPLPASPVVVSPLPAAGVVWCQRAELPAPPACHLPPPLGDREGVLGGSLRGFGGNSGVLRGPRDPEDPTLRALSAPCSQSSTSMLGGMLSARFAMCFSNVVFPFLPAKEGLNTAGEGGGRVCDDSPSLPTAPPPPKGEGHPPVGSDEAVAAAGHDVKVGVDVELLPVGRDAELLQLRWGVRGVRNLHPPGIMGQPPHPPQPLQPTPAFPSIMV